MTSPAEWLVKRDINIGGISAVILGALGAGKTTLLLRLAERLMNRDIVIWRMMYSCQFQRFPQQEKIILYFLEEDYKKAEFRDLKTGKKVNIEDMYRVVTANSFKRLYTKMKTRHLNVLYLDNDAWYRFMEYLIYRYDNRWISLMFDEFKDLAPSYPTREQWTKVWELDKIIREFRKRCISIYIVIHDPNDLFYAIRDKFMFRIYLKGAKRIRKSQVWQRAINKLELGQAIVEGNSYEWMTFRPILTQPTIILRIRKRRRK